MKTEFDEGFAFGKGFFETIDVRDGVPVDLFRHVRRINRSLKTWGIAQSVSESEIKDYIRENDIKDAALKLMVSDKNKQYVTRPNPHRDKAADRKLRLKISPVLRNSTSLYVQHKSLAVYENIYLFREAKKEGFDEVLFVNEKGHVCEGAVTNIFFVDREERIFTPPVSAGILPGTKREAIMEKYPVIERDIPFEEVSDFEGAFVTNALMGAVEVRSIGDILFPSAEKTVEKIQKN